MLGPTSFQDIRTVDGQVFQTFKEAAIKLKLLKDDQEWFRTMEEAATFQMPVQLRMLFSMILIHGDIVDGRSLYNACRNDLIEDYLLTHSEYMAEQLALRDIEEHLQQFGKKCEHFQLESPVEVGAEENNMDQSMDSDELDRLMSMMNSEQRTAFQIIIDSVEGRISGKCFFLSGAGGCGKTFLYKVLSGYVENNGGVVKAVAPTGLAATLLKNGKTVHSGFGLPLDLTERSVSRFSQRCSDFEALSRTKLIIWDEISMCHHYMLEAVDRSLRDLMNKEEAFGGITIVVGGDFRQQAPVVVRGKKVDIVEACAKSSPLWRQFQELKLIKNMRVNQNELEFVDWLLKVGDGGADIDPAFLRVPDDCLTDNLVRSVFGEDINSLSHVELASRAILCPKNVDTAAMNAV